MISDLSFIELGKKTAALKALQFVNSGMIIGLGTGSTASWFVKLLAERITKEGLEVSCVPTSTQTREQAKSLKIPLISLAQVDYIDLVVDGADEFDSTLNLIKGGGGALLQEKIVAAASRKMLVITDSSKESLIIGSFSLPVEIVQFGASSTKRHIEHIVKNMGFSGAGITYRMNKYKEKFVTDEGHFIVDLELMEIRDALLLESNLVKCPGVVETGLFLGMATTIIVGKADGTCKLIGSQSF